MSLFSEGDYKKLEELKKKANRVLREGYDIIYEPYEKRVDLWNRIKEDYEKYKDGECGTFCKDVDRVVRRDFEWALATLAFSFYHNNESFPGIKRYSFKELQLVEYILKYNVFELWTVEDILREISKANRDGTNETLNLLKEYYNNIGKKVEELVKDHTIKLPIRDYAKTKWEEYKSKMDEAIFRAMREIDWFSDFITGVDSKINELENRINKLHNLVYEEKRKLEEEFKHKKEVELAKIEEMKEELKRKFEIEKEKIKMEIEMEKNKELQERLKKEVENIEKSYKELIEELNEKIKLLESEKNELKEKKDELENILRKIREAKKVGSRFVKLENALSYEEWFVGRLDKKLDEMKDSGIRVDNRIFNVVSIEESWDSNNSKLPKNKQIKAILKEKKLIPFGKRMEIMLVGMFLTNRENYEKMGFDVYPISLGKVVEVIENVKAYNFDKVVLLIASPTGFEKEVVEFVNSDNFKMRYLSKKIALALLDVETGELYYNEVDEYAKAFAPLMSLEFDAEKIERLKRYIDENIVLKGYITLEEAINEIGDERVAKKVFYEYEKGETKYIEEVGFVLIKK
ncbi:coiled-coil domain-containing protein [Methanotorris igneus]|uniref:Uncharacterized protein n=1 Tax=Methanotorris igneus (strain DSM 5666 / JCM 11834 / Kol 5) TaxID=880724 RepID=F6BBS8_METIK|nr:hypothetical protein [Methanotorris igneus]AEF97208.1 hypothetical protein Metig_1676 [Methanotorris igneus Kol 5]